MPEMDAGARYLKDEAPAPLAPRAGGGGSSRSSGGGGGSKVKQSRYTPWRHFGRGGKAPTHPRPRH
jgi:hypothetical protein